MKRQSNIEFLRIFSMILIVAHHYVNHGGSYWCAGNKMNIFISTALMIGGTLGVNLFVMITGYFMINKSFQWIRIIRLEVAVLFYSILFYGIACFVWHTETISFLSLRNILLPTLTNLETQYWFIPCYFALLFISPFLNILIQNISREQYKRLLLILLLLGSIVPTLFQTTPLYDGNFMVFVIMYLLGGYVSKYSITIKAERNYLMGLLVGTGYILLAFFTFIFKQYPQKLSGWGLNEYALWARYSFFIIGLAIILFIFFKQMKIHDNKIINTISATTVGIYLIHDNVYVRGYLWSKVLYAQNYYNSPRLLLHAVFCVIMVFVVCSVIEYIRAGLMNLVLRKIELCIKEN